MDLPTPSALFCRASGVAHAGKGGPGGAPELPELLTGSPRVAIGVLCPLTRLVAPQNDSVLPPRVLVSASRRTANRVSGPRPRLLQGDAKVGK